MTKVFGLIQSCLMKERVLCSIHREKMVVVMMSGQHEIVLCDFQDVEVGEPRLVLSLVSL